MKRLTRSFLTVLLVLGAVETARPFSLLGIIKTWQTPDIGYGLAGDIGGPMFPTEAYRWNVPNITYAFDESFIRYFGTNGIVAAEQAIKILNDLPSASAMSADLTEFQMQTRGVNNKAQALGMHDLKSFVLTMLIEQMGLANPERFVWSLRAAGQPYTVLKLNYDPVTMRASSWVNGVLYGYQILDPVTGGVVGTNGAGAGYASAVEVADPNPDTAKYSSVAGALGNPDLAFIENGIDYRAGPVFGGLLAGHYLKGITRDDAGGIRFLLRPDNVVTEILLTNVIADSTVSPWMPWGGTNTATNAVGTNALAGTNFLRQALRGGVNKVTFQRVNYDSMIGLAFIAITNRYDDHIITNGVAGKQKVQRVIVTPDILFTAADLGVGGNGPVTFARTDTTGWINNDLINGTATLGGPGLINSPIVISFTDNAPFFLKFGPNPFGNCYDIPFVWASFDWRDSYVIYPQYLNYSVDYFADQVLNEGGVTPCP